MNKRSIDCHLQSEYHIENVFTQNSTFILICIHIHVMIDFYLFCRFFIRESSTDLYTKTGVNYIDENFESERETK